MLRCSLPEYQSICVFLSLLFLYAYLYLSFHLSTLFILFHFHSNTLSFTFSLDFYVLSLPQIKFKSFHLFWPSLSPLLFLSFKLHFFIIFSFSFSLSLYFFLFVVADFFILNLVGLVLHYVSCLGCYSPYLHLCL